MATDSALESAVQTIRRTDGALGRLLRDADPARGLEHTPREIAQQPYLWRHTARQMQAHAPALEAFLRRAGMYAASCRPHVILTGAGTSDYVGQSICDLLRLHFGTACVNWPTTRITASPETFFAPGQAYLMLHFARSGNSPESKNVLQLALKHYPENVRHVVLTCNDEGELAQVARAHPEAVYLVVLHEASNDRALAMTSSFSNMVVAGQALAHLGAMEAFVALVGRIAQAGEHLIRSYADAIFDLAAPDVDRVFYLGNNDLLGGAVESALKVQELTIGQVMAKGEDTLAFRHGPISAVDARTMIAFYLSADPYTRRYEADVLAQYGDAFQRLGVRTVALAGRLGDGELPDGAFGLSYDPDGVFQVPPYYQVNVAVLFGQLFGLFSSYRRGLNVDNPAVDKALYSRTVQGVRLHDYAGVETQAG